MKTNNELIGSKRTSIMGVAAIWIMIFHGTIEVPASGIMTFIKTGYLGVDMFMFMSGFSMYRSFTKTCKMDSLEFIKRRFLKILSLFIPFAILWYVLYFCQNYPTMELLLEAMRTKVFWITMITFRWFIPCILFCYSITPIIHSIFDKFGFKIQTLCLMILPLLLVSFLFNGSSVALMILLRIPTYIIGYYYGENTTQKTSVSARMLIVILGFVGYYLLINNYSDVYLCDSGLYWYPAIFLSSSLILCVATMFERFSSKVVRFFGTYSLEVYLWHAFLLFPCLAFVEEKNIQMDEYNIIINILVIIITMPVSYGYSKLIGTIGKKLRILKQ